MVRMIRITAGAATVEAELRKTPTAKAIERALPLTGRADRWGGEIYFEIPVTAELEADSREVLLPGEIGYWPEGRCMCIFLGPTPASEGEEIRPASAVNVFGHLKGSWEGLKSVPVGTEIHVERVDKGATGAGPAAGTERSGAVSGVPRADTLMEPGVPEAAEEAPDDTLDEGAGPDEVGGPADIEETAESAVYAPVAIEPTGSEPEIRPPVPEISEPIEYPAEMEAEATADGAVGKVRFEMTRPTLWLCVGVGAVLAVVAFALGLAARRGDGGVISLRQDVDANAAALDEVRGSVGELTKSVQEHGSQISRLRQAEQQIAQLKQQVAPLDRRLSAVEEQAGGLALQWVRDPRSGHSYAVTPYALPWHAAKAYAERVGAHLATVTSEAENEFLVIQFGEGIEYWIGLNDEKEEGKWVWVTGEPFEYANWAPGEPDNYRQKQHFVVINDTKPDRGHVEPGKWNDVLGNEAHLAILEKDR